MRYILKDGEKAVVVQRQGTSIGKGGWMHRTMASIAILREDGSKVYRGHSPYWLGYGTIVYASHYRSGRSKADEAAYQAEVARLRAIVERANSEGCIEIKEE